MALSDRIETLRQLLGHPANEGARLRAFTDYLRWNFGYRALANADQVLPLAGDARIILSARQNYATLAYVNRLWDFADMVFLLHFLRPGDWFGDLGANVGGYTMLATRCAGAHALAVEPVPGTYQELLANIRLNDVAPLADARQAALGDKPGSIRMTAALGGMNHVATERFTGETVEVPVLTLDSLTENRRPALIKMDAEGYELAILQGGPATFADPTLHAVIVELNNSGGRYGFSDDAVDAALRGHGFAPYAYDPFERSLTPMKSFNRVDFNTLYLRGVDAMRNRVAGAAKYSLRGREI